MVVRNWATRALLDVMMPGMDGLTMLSHLREQNDNLRVIIMTALNTPETAVSALRDQPCDWLRKPFEIQQLLSAVQTALEPNPRDGNIPRLHLVRVPCGCHITTALDGSNSLANLRVLGNKHS